MEKLPVDTNSRDANPYYPSPPAEAGLSAAGHPQQRRSLSLLSVSSSADAATVSSPLTPDSEFTDNASLGASLNPLLEVLPPLPIASAATAAAATAAIPAAVAADPTVIVKRPRGRPRKHQKTIPDPQVKPGKGRSKTGCLTCRERKKKCDETKPTCLNCSKNGKPCKGYPPLPEPAQKGTKRPPSDASTTVDVSPMPVVAAMDDGCGTQQMMDLSLMSPISPEGAIPDFPGVYDSMLWDHLITSFSDTLWPRGRAENGLRALSIRIRAASTSSAHHLRPALLALSAAHLLAASNANPATWPLRYQLSQIHDEYCSAALSALTMNDPSQEQDDWFPLQLMLVCLHYFVVNGVDQTNLRKCLDFHLRFGRHFLAGQMAPPCLDWGTLYLPFFWHTTITRAILAPCMCAGPHDDHCNSRDMFEPVLPHSFQTDIPQQSHSGVPNDLMRALLDIARLRHRIRHRRSRALNPVMDYEALNTCDRLLNFLGSWSTPGHLEYSSHTLSTIFRRAALVYLHNTREPTNKYSLPMFNEVNRALNETQNLLQQGLTQHVLLPLFLIGCCNSDLGQRERIHALFDTADMQPHFINVNSAKAGLVYVWKSVDSGRLSVGEWELALRDYEDSTLII